MENREVVRWDGAGSRQQEVGEDGSCESREDRRE